MTGRVREKQHTREDKSQSGFLYIPARHSAASGLRVQNGRKPESGVHRDRASAHRSGQRKPNIGCVISHLSPPVGATKQISARLTGCCQLAPAFFGSSPSATLVQQRSNGKRLFTLDHTFLFARSAIEPFAVHTCRAVEAASGHQRRFERPLGMSAMPPIATKSLHRGNRRVGP
jgi:hypothetical protein